MLGQLARRNGFVVGGLLFALSACSDPSPQLAAPLEAAPQFAGSESCAACHASQVHSWSANPMARTIEVTRVGELDGLGTVEDQPAGYRYRFTRSADGKQHILGEEHEDDPQHALGCEVLFAIGAGTLDRSYVLGHGAGMWFAPVEVVTHAKGREAVLAPHVSIRSGSRFQVPITAECLGCHTDSLPPRGFPLNLRQSAKQWSPRGISCAACHEGAEAHAAWQRSGQGSGDESARSTSGSDPLLMQAQMDREEQLSVCAACHLQGDARLVLDGTDLGPPQPGGDLLLKRALFVAREATEDVGFVSQVERLTLSECYLQSEMTCVTCHDPHRALAAEGERERVRRACVQCHGDSRDNGAMGCSRIPRASGAWPWPAWSNDTRKVGEPDCVACHMPRTGVFDVARVTIHDHYIRRDPQRVRGPSTDQEVRALESPTADWRRFAWPGKEIAGGNDTGLWMMAYASQGFGAEAEARLDSVPGPQAVAIPMYHHLRAGLLRNAGRDEAARAAYEQALELDPGLTESAINLGLLLAATGERLAGLELLDNVLEQHPAAWSARRNRAVIRAELGNLPGAIEDLQQAFEALPSAEVARGLVKLCLARDDPSGAEHWRVVARQLEPESFGH